MEPFTLQWAAARLGARIIGDDTTLTGVCIDTRKIEPGALFFALPGEQADGHRFVAQAFANGAAAAVVSREVENVSGPLLLVPDTVQALGDLAMHYRRQFTIPVVGITGSVGKTSTKEMTATALRARYNTLASEKNYNTEIGVPLTLFRLDRTHEVAVIEMGMRGMGQIDRLTEIAEPTIGVITNIGFSHIELLGSQQNIAQAKAELLARLPQDGIAILPVYPGSQWEGLLSSEETPDLASPDLSTSYVALEQEELFAYLRGRVPPGCRLVTYGQSVSKPVDVSLWPNQDPETWGMAGIAIVHDKEYPFALKVPGLHNVINAQAALAVADALGVPVEAALAALSEWQGAVGRMTVKTLPIPSGKSERGTQSPPGFIMVLDDCYNASPESMEVALSMLAGILTRNKIAILGDMKELGELAVPAHRIIGRRVAELDLRTLITVGPLAVEIRDEVRRLRGDRRYPECYHYRDADEAASRVHVFVDGSVDGNPVVLVKGSRAMQMEKIVAALTGETKADDHG
jgi:UDP-N-acetylmuramoyl-tripeptide--D-alanyl-D-alanine ligase